MLAAQEPSYPHPCRVGIVIWAVVISGTYHDVATWKMTSFFFYMCCVYTNIDLSCVPTQQ